MRHAISHGWRLVILQDKIQVTEQSLIQQTNRLNDLQHSTLALTDIDGQSERCDPNNRLFLSSVCTYMIVSTVFFKLPLWHTSAQSYFILKVLEGGG